MIQKLNIFERESHAISDLETRGHVHRTPRDTIMSPHVMIVVDKIFSVFGRTGFGHKMKGTAYGCASTSITKTEWDVDDKIHYLKQFSMNILAKNKTNIKRRRKNSMSGNIWEPMKP